MPVSGRSGEQGESLASLVTPERWAARVRDLNAEVERLRGELGDAVDQARLFNRGGLSWREYDRLLVRWAAIADAGAEPVEFPF